ncbi:MAG: class II fructose-bisphosphate aldolase [Puniceicoccaceae bacterium]
MKILTQRSEVLAEMARAATTRRPILCPNAETPDEMEGILAGAEKFARERDLPSITVGVGITAGYPDHPQLRHLSADGSADAESLTETARIWLGWLALHAGRNRYGRVRAIPFLDHGWAPLEGDRALMEETWFHEAMGILMFDASAFSLEENTRLTAEFVERFGGRVVIEACPDKVYERAEAERLGLREADLLSDPARVAAYVRATGVDLIVPNLGTEHRTTSKEPLAFRSEIADALAERVGPIMALHGTSSLGGKIGEVGRSGIVKINYYTGMAGRASERLLAEWTAAADPLPIARACGSFVHRTRRNAVAADIDGMLQTLHS